MADDVRSLTKKGLTAAAYEPIAEGEEYVPYVPASESPAELTLKSLAFGILFGIVFGAANAYLGLMAGLTISTSIPVAVMTVAAFRALRKMGTKSSLLEANEAQTVGSASSSVASGVIFTLPALFLWGMPPGLLSMTLLAVCGGLLGVLFMIPLRRFLIAKEHGHLPYPEGTACAEVLVASEVGGGRAKNVFIGLGLGALFKAVVDAVRLFPNRLETAIPFLPKGEISSKVSAALFGVGYILGPKIATVMVGGGLLSSLVIIPGIAIWGAGRAVPFYPETELLISQMDPGLIWERYVRYIGAGAVAAAGIITLAKSIPTMIESFKVGSAQLRRRLEAASAGREIREDRTDRDLSLRTLGAGILILFLAMAAIPDLFYVLDSPLQRAVAAFLVILCAFFFVTVSSRIVGLVGVTSNPTSGMTIATLLLTATVFLIAGWTGDLGRAGALTIGCVVAIAASIAGDTSQDLKTGFLLGATPRNQQIGELIGVATSAVFVCITVIFLAQTYGFGTDVLPAPQATLMKLVIDGVLEQSLPWVLVGIGAGIAIVCELLRIPSLPFAVGVYLPVSTMVPIFLGGLLRMAAERKARDAKEAGERRERGVLLGSGLVGGEGLMGVAIAGLVYVQQFLPEETAAFLARGVGYEWAGAAAQLVALAAFVGLGAYFWRRVVRA